jgi:hypothetical protein
MTFITHRHIVYTTIFLMSFQAAIAPESTEEITSITDGLGLCYLYIVTMESNFLHFS